MGQNGRQEAIASGRGHKLAGQRLRLKAQQLLLRRFELPLQLLIFAAQLLDVGQKTVSGRGQFRYQAAHNGQLAAVSGHRTAATQKLQPHFVAPLLPLHQLDKSHLARVRHMCASTRTQVKIANFDEAQLGVIFGRPFAQGKLIQPCPIYQMRPDGQIAPHSFVGQRLGRGQIRLAQVGAVQINGAGGFVEVEADGFRLGRA